MAIDQLIMLAMIFVAVTLSVLYYLQWLGNRGNANQYERQDRSQMPAELAQAHLFVSEKVLRLWRPVRLVAKPDQVFQTAAGMLIPVENKTRKWHRVYASDIIELSVQGTVLRGQGHVVAEYGYVRTIAGGASKYHRTPLLNNDDVYALRDRYIRLLGGTATPDAPENPRICNTCPQRGHCAHGPVTRAAME
jgi:hypothetical protein